jgi:CBS domain-containing protein
MAERRLNRVVVVDVMNKPVGIITQKDIVGFLLVDTSMRGIEEIKAEEVMSKTLVTIGPKATILEVAKIMIKKKISSLIVIDINGKLRGIITKADLNAWYGYRGTLLYKVHSFMTKNPITVRPSQPIFLAASLMSLHKISRVIVVDKENKPIGILTLFDMTILSNLLKPARVQSEGSPLLVRGLITIPKLVHLVTIGDLMTANPISINEDADLKEAAMLMAKNGISGLPVIDNTGKVVGIVTKSDIIKAVASSKISEGM